MVLRAKENSFGAWMFLVGIILAVVIGVVSSSFLPLSNIGKFSPMIYALLVLLGLVIGFSINVYAKDSQTFLITSAVLIIVSRFGMESVNSSLIGIGIGDLVTSTFAALLALFIPVTIIVSVKTLFNIAKI